MRVVGGANRIVRRGLGSGDNLMDEETIRATGQGEKRQPRRPAGSRRLLIVRLIQAS